MESTTLAAKAEAELREKMDFGYWPPIAASMATVAPMKIQRFNMNGEPDIDGDYVRYADHVVCMLNPSGTRLTNDDRATNALMQGVIDSVAECEQDELFAGFQVQEQRRNGQLLSVRLVACDRIGDVAVPRAV